MRRVVTAALIVPLITAVASPATAEVQNRDFATYVDPFAGAKAGDTPETNTYAGDTFPGADVPFGMVQWSPDTPLQPKPPAGQGRYYARDRDGGYAWEENKLRGFSLTHFNGAGCGGAAGDVPFLPFAGNLSTSPAVDATKYFPTFSHGNESASPGYYKVTTDSGITTELTATQRSGLGRFTFPKNSPATLLIDVAQSAMGSDDASVTVDPARRTVEGWVSSGHFCRGPNTYKVYFTASFDQPFTTSGTWQDATVTPGGTSARGGDLSKATWDKQVVTADGGSGAYLTFDPAKPVQVRVGLSYVDMDGARLNVAAEQRHDSFDAVKDNARRTWNDRLRQIAVEGGTDAATRTFYTALYHTLMQPNVFSDVDGRYAGFDKAVHRTKPGHAQYANFSGWDTYRDEVQLLSMLAPHEAADMAQSMLNQANQAGGIWDRWSQNNDFMGVMGGDPYHSIIASTYAFGATDFDASQALKSMVNGATRVQQAGERALERPGLSDYLALGYHPEQRLGHARGDDGRLRHRPAGSATRSAEHLPAVHVAGAVLGERLQPGDRLPADPDARRAVPLAVRSRAVPGNALPGRERGAVHVDGAVRRPRPLRRDGRRRRREEASRLLLHEAEQRRQFRRTRSCRTSRRSRCRGSTPTRARRRRRRTSCAARRSCCSSRPRTACPATTTSARRRRGTSSPRSACTRRRPAAPRWCWPARCSRRSP